MHHSILLIPEMLVFSFSGQWLWPKRMNALVTQYIRLYHTFHSEINDLFFALFSYSGLYSKIHIIFLCYRALHNLVFSEYLPPSETSWVFLEKIFLVSYPLPLIQPWWMK